MAAKTGAKPAAKAVAKAAATPKSTEAAGKPAATPGVGASADSTANMSGDASGGSQESSDGDADAARLLSEDMARLEGEALLMDAEFNLVALSLAHEEALAMDSEFSERQVRNEALAMLEDEARAMDAARTESLETTQTSAEEGAGGDVNLNVWALPEIGKFPATVILENHTRNRIGVPGANVALDPYENVEATVSQEQYAKLAKSLSSSARAHKWDNLKGLQVKYDRKD